MINSLRALVFFFFTIRIFHHHDFAIPFFSFPFVVATCLLK